MRKVTANITNAWKMGSAKKVKNTRTDGERIYLHGNCIAKRENGSVYISTGGWNTLTTRERLNGIVRSLGLRMSIHQHRHNLYFWTAEGGSVPWDGEWLMVR